MKTFLTLVLIITCQLNICFSINSDAGSDVLVIRDDDNTSSENIISDAGGFGYTVNSVIPDELSNENLGSYSVLILATGSNSNALENNEMRFMIQNYVLNGGKIIIEGGQTGYITTVLHVFPSFQNKVLRISNFVTHSGGNLRMVPDKINSEIATFPNILPEVININFSSDRDMDVCTANEFSEVFYGTSLFNDKSGILAYPSVNNPQIINYCFNYDAVSERSDSKYLLCNTLYKLIGYPVSSGENTEIIPADYKLSQNFPNPFNPSTAISLEIPKRSYVTLIIYNEKGAAVSTLLSGMTEAGSYKIKWNADEMSSGVYFYRMISDNFIETKKMILLR